MSSTCPFVRSSVRSFVCYQLVNALFPKRMNRVQCKLAQIFAGGKGIHDRRLGSGGQRSIKVTGGRGCMWKAGGKIILDRLSRVDKGIQWATEMLHTILTVAPLPRLPDMRLADALVYFILDPSFGHKLSFICFLSEAMGLYEYFVIVANCKCQNGYQLLITKSVTVTYTYNP